MDPALLPYFKLMIDLIKNVNEFNAENSAQLPDFFQQVESILPGIENFPNDQKQILFSLIKNKCTGRCRQALHTEGNVNSWEELKTALKKHFGEKKSINDLMDELKTLTLKGTIENYYNRINRIVARINNKRLTYDENTYTAEEVNRKSLRTFRDNMPEPTRTMLLAREPADLEKAYQIILDAKQQNLTQFGVQSQTVNNRNSMSYRNNDNRSYNNNTRHSYNNNFNKQNNSYSNNRQNTNSTYNNNYNRQNTNNNYNRQNDNNNYRGTNHYNNNDKYSGTARNNTYSQNTRPNNTYSQNTRRNFVNTQSQERQSNSNRPFSGNSRRTTVNQNNSVEPMDITQVDSDFRTRGSSSYLT